MIDPAMSGLPPRRERRARQGDALTVDRYVDQHAGTVQNRSRADGGLHACGFK
jgi:hypothetical protein